MIELHPVELCMHSCIFARESLDHSIFLSLQLIYFATAYFLKAEGNPHPANALSL